MAFKMNKPIIKGSALHKEAVAKLQRLDHSSLITAAQALGQSTTPGAVDFSVDRKIDMSSYEKPKKKKKEKKEEETVIEEPVIEVQVSGVGDRQIANYNKEQQKRLQTEGVFNEEAGRVVLPEEIIDGKFVGLKAEDIHIVETGKKQQKIFQPRIRESQKTDITIKGKQVSKGRLRILDKLWAKSGPSVRENLRSEGYIPAEERNNAQASR
jgi:hypothetical protein